MKEARLAQILYSLWLLVHQTLYVLNNFKTQTDKSTEALDMVTL